jgi:hypothetical protein
MKAITTQAGGTPGAPGPRLGQRSGLLPVALAVIFGALIVYYFSHRENRYEKLASDVTKAVAANDMRPVEKDFNALRRPQLEDRGKVGQLSDFVNADGTLKRVKEDTPADSKAGYHHFIAEFDKGNLSEDLTVDADGKIADFHVRPLDTK